LRVIVSRRNKVVKDRRLLVMVYKRNKVGKDSGWWSWFNRRIKLVRTLVAGHGFIEKQSYGLIEE
jgi:hypothetical protein